MTLAGFDCSQGQDHTPIQPGDSFGFARATLGNVPDTKYAYHTANITAAKLTPGAYLFLMGPGRNVPVPLQVAGFASVAKPGLAALDWESDTYLTHNYGRQPFSGVLQGIDEGRKHGITFGVYASLSLFTGTVLTALKKAHVPFIWVAAWGINLPASITDCGIPVFQQFAGGNSPDRDRFYGTEAELRALAGLAPPVSYAPWPPTNLVPLTCHRVVDLQADVVLSANGKPWTPPLTHDVTLGMLGAVNAEFYHVADGDAGVYVRRTDAVVRTADLAVGA